MALKKFQTQDGLKLQSNDAIVGANNQPIFFSSAENVTSIGSGVDANSPYWTSLVNGYSNSLFYVEAVQATASEAPVITLPAGTVLQNGTRVQIDGAMGMTGLNSTWYVKASIGANQYELYTNYGLDEFTDLSGEDPYVARSGSLRYNTYYAVYRTVAHDSAGNIIAAGFTSTEGFTQVLIGKYSPTGANLWLQVLDDPAYNLDGWGMAVDSEDNLFLAVNNNTRILISKLNGQTGAITWQTGITSPTGEYGFSLELASDGHPVVAGRMTNLSDATEDFLVAKVSKTDGQLIWSKSLNNGLNQNAYSLACDSHGHIVVVGSSSQEVGPDVILVVKMNLEGSILSIKSIQGVADTYDITGVDTAIDSSDNIYISASGGTEVNSAAFLIKMTSAGTIAWTRMIGPGRCATVGLSLALDGDDRIYMFAANGQDSPNVPQFDMVFGCYNSSGQPLFQRYWGSPQAWETATDINPIAGQMISVYEDKIAVVGWYGHMDATIYPVGNVSAMISQLPKDGSLISIGQQRMRVSNFAGTFITLNTLDQVWDAIFNPLEQSTSSMTVQPGLLVSVSTSDWPTQTHTWTFGNDGGTALPGGLDVVATPWAEDIWIGDEVTFLKTNYGDETDSIDEGLTITRGYQAGIYNSDQEDVYDDSTYLSPLGTEWNGEGWSDLSNVKYRSYTTWREAVYPPNNAVGRELVMHDTVNDKYYTVKFLSWQASSLGGGFSYVRREINTHAYFVKQSNGDEIDLISPGLSLTRGTYDILYNPAAGESSPNDDYSPINTLWNGDGWDNLGNLKARQWLSFYYAMNGENVGKRVLGREWIMWDTNNNEYYAIQFTSWQPGSNGGSFSYVRRRINKAAITHGIKFPDGSVQRSAFNQRSAGTVPQNRYDAIDDRLLNIDDTGKHVLITTSGVNVRLPGIGDQPWVVGTVLTIINRTGGDIYLNKINDYENGNIYGAGTNSYGTNWIISDAGGGNICTLICTDISGNDYPTVNWILSGPGISTP